MANALPPLVLPANTLVGNIGAGDAQAAAIPISTLLASIGLVDNNIAALKNLAVPISAGVYIVLGYTTPGDGGQGIFFWNAADSTADNGGTVIACTANGANAGRFNKLL